MSTQEGVQRRIETIAQESLDSFATISSKAQTALADASGRRETTQIASNTFTNSSADKNLQRGRADILDEYRTLSREPSIARVAVEDEDGTKKTYYFCRKGNLSGLPLSLVSLLAPVGRLASLPVGEEYDLPNGQSVTVLENVRFSPKIANQEWDTHKAEIRGNGYAKTIESLRALLRQMGVETIDENVLEALLSEESASENITDGIRRSVIEKMDLRDQPILDQYQDRIFRLPLDSQLLILGAPGANSSRPQFSLRPRSAP